MLGAPNLAAACITLFAPRAHLRPLGQSGPRRGAAQDPLDRDARNYPHYHPIGYFATVGDIFSAATNPERENPFDIHTVMRVVVDQDHVVLERCVPRADADGTLIFNAYPGGSPVTVLGVESRPIPRRGALPADGPDQLDRWDAGALREDGGGGRRIQQAHNIERAPSLPDASTRSLLRGNGAYLIGIVARGPGGCSTDATTTAVAPCPSRTTSGLFPGRKGCSMHPFVLNRHDRIVFPSGLVPQLDLSVIDSLDQLDSVILRDFETKAPTGTDILRRVEARGYDSRYALVRDVALNMFWTS